MTQSGARKILLASDRDGFSEVIRSLERRGFEVTTSRDGSHTLERALALVPDLLVLDVDISLIEAGRLAQILRANPRTEKMAFIFVGPEGRDIEGFRRYRDHYLTRPFNTEQLLAVTLGHLLRQDRTEQVTRQGKQVEGNLEQVSLTDMLQIFGHNRKDGTLSLERHGRRGEIFLLEGSVINARVDRVEGEKAFFRLLDWTQGHFSFCPDIPHEEVRIMRPLDHLIMEGLRQSDELTSLASSLPQPDSLLFLKVPLDRLPRGLRPTTQEILVLLEYYQRVDDILDHCPRPDYDILQVLRILLEKGVVEERREEAALQQQRAPLLKSEEIIQIKDYLGERDSLLEDATAKLVFLATRPADIQNFLQYLRGFNEFDSEPSASLTPETDAPFGLCYLGVLRLGETFALRVLCLPARPDAAPLWAPFSRRLFGVLALSGNGTLESAQRFFENQGRVPLARICWAGDASDTLYLERGDRDGLRRLLIHFLNRLMKKDDL
jgi:CheY-like chemotaxis protein